MTNCNERLDEILTTCDFEPEYFNSRICKWCGGRKGAEIHTVKQALTSLIKELVVEAKPEKRELIEPVTGESVSSGDKVTVDVEADPRGSLIFVQNNGYNMGLDQFEQNLLKVLEEV